MEPPAKHQKSISAKLVLHIYKQANTHLNTEISQLIAYAFFFGIQYCEYSTIPKGENKHTKTLQRGDILFYIKHHELTNKIKILNLANKVSPTFRTHKNRVKDTTVTKWRMTTNL